MRSQTNILLVDDDPTHARLISRLLVKSGIESEITELNDGDQATDYLLGRGNYGDRNRHPLPQLVLLDLRMPGTDGFAVLRAVKASTVARRIPMVVLSSSCDPRDVNQAYDLGANGYVVKPMDFSEFSEAAEALKAFWLSANTAPAADA